VTQGATIREFGLERDRFLHHTRSERLRNSAHIAAVPLYRLPTAGRRCECQSYSPKAVQFSVHVLRALSGGESTLICGFGTAPWQLSMTTAEQVHGEDAQAKTPIRAML